MKTYEMVSKAEASEMLDDLRSKLRDCEDHYRAKVAKITVQKKELADQLYKWTGFAQMFVKGTEFTITKDTLDMLNRMGYVKKEK